MMKGIKMKKVFDGIGELEEEGLSLIGNIKFKIFGSSYDIKLRFKVYDKGFDGLSTELLLSARNGLDILNNHPEKIMDLVTEFYQTEVKEMADDGYCDYIEIKDGNQFSDIIRPEEFFLKIVGNDNSLSDIYMGIYFECDWDDEGFAIRFDGEGNFIKMGTGDILY